MPATDYYTLGDVPVHTFGELLVELKAKYRTLPRADYLDYFKQAHSITAATFRPAVEQLLQALVGLENLGPAYIAGFKEYSETDEYQERFPEYQAARDWKSKKSKHGRKGQRATISLSTVDLEQALKLAGQNWSIPSPEEITAENLFIDRVLGTLTSVPENSQSYAETMASESPAPTPQQSSRYISVASGPPPWERQHTPNNARSETPPGHHARHETPAPRTPIATRRTSLSGSRQSVQFTPVNQRLPSSSFPPSPTPPCATTNTYDQREPLTSHMPPAPLKSRHGARDETLVPARPTTPESNSSLESPITAPSMSGHGPRDKTPPLVSSDTASQNNKRTNEAPTAGSELGVTDQEILGEEDLHGEEEPCLCLTSSIFDQAILSQIEAEANKKRPLGWTTERARQARVNFLRKLAKPLTEAEQDNSQIRSQHLDEIRRATGLSGRVTYPELVHQLAALASNCDTVESWDEYTHRNAQRSLWFSAPVFEHNLFSQFHYQSIDVPLKMPVSNDGWDFLISDLMKHVSTLTDDPRSLLAS
ncbi:uncharacterized protein BP01DRAFT_400709 [Aspergillus saccharolyticus JOP 1030-1]|uniref:Uncharacterized protein n=1 Tax=Aspergillus saccharolyticus JOP 1030-1 TaxID=1450539 RepID=A0A318ZP28_9EURO|nr:hypothetical protein BP01DRAFT_400709 [Aspergillus saccharolyticus JOP 1030-1]PYH49349.1 hypothetical protein BP01DRAFT_400709 [Aspergillus saccharolyticus JOP 1030-1]